ncbi:MAG TPA: hypothetical protein GX000_01070 [Actinomyces sp.]|nr:hypothetical protein [Actinomyces sp.]
MARTNRPEGWIHDWQPDGEPNGPKPSSSSGGKNFDADSFAPGDDDLLPPEDKEERSNRFFRHVATIPGRLLITLALLSAGIAGLLGIIGASTYGSWGWWIPIIAGGLGIAITLFFAVRRKQLQDAIARSGPRTIIGEQRTVVTYDGEDGQTSQQQQLHDMAQREGEKVRRAREEFEVRSARYLPRVEALQRAMRQMVDPSYDAAWLEIDIRPTLISFLATVAVVPLCGFLIVMTAFALLLTAM